MNSIFLLGNGINNNPGSANCWNREGALWIEENAPPFRAQAFPYFSDTIFRKFYEPKRIREVIAILDELTYFEKKYIVGHSFFGDITAGILNQWKGRLEEIHLFAPAMDPDCDRNGINKAIEEDRLGHAYIYASTSDQWLRVASRTQWFMRFFRNQFGDAGRVGLKNVKYPVRTTVIWRNTYLHSDWFYPQARFIESMNLVTGKIARV